jgi:MFS family permease
MNRVRRISLSGRSIIVTMCVGQLGSLLPHVVVPSILAAFLIPEWHLSGAQAGLLAGSGAAGYMLTVPVLATLTDRIDARRILIAGSAVSALGTLLFGIFATGLWSGAFFNAIAGIGFAGAYMPGLKALTDRLAPGDSSRAITLYTSSFSFGVGLSFLVSQLVAEAWGWRAAFLVTALGPLVMLSATCCGRSRQNPRKAACWISRRCSATPMRWASFTAMARIALSSTVSGPGWSRSGPSWR